MPRPFQCVVTVLTPATTETEDPPTVSLAPQYTSQRLCHASKTTTRFKTGRFTGILRPWRFRPRRTPPRGCKSYTAECVVFSLSRPQTLPDDRRQPVREALDFVLLLPFDHDARQRLGAGVAEQQATALAERGLGRARAPRDLFDLL